MAIKIYGASDDLIEIEGDIEEEFGFFPDDEEDSRVLAFSDGTLLRAHYDRDGIWRLTKIADGLADFDKVEGNVTADTNDTVTLSGEEIKWVVMGLRYAS